VARSKEYAHLPRGRQPGPQTLKGYGLGRSGFVVKAIGVLMVAGGLVLYFFGMACKAGDDECQIEVKLGIGGALLLVGVLLYWLGAYLDRRKRRRNAGHLQLSLPRDTFRLGETIQPRFEVTNLKRLEGNVEVGLVCTVFYDYEYEAYTQHGRATSRQTQTVTALENWIAVQRAYGPQDVSLTIPLDGPYSHEGKAVSYAWKVSARERRSGFDRFTDLPIWVETWV
jgi:hypothetical protein